MANILSLIVLGATVWILIWWIKVKRFWNERGVPHMTPYPFFGNITFILTQNTSVWLRRAYHKFRSAPYFGVWFLWKPVIIVNSPELAHRILVKDFDVFRNRFMSSGEADIIGSMNLVMVKEPHWSIIRKCLSPVFSTKNLKRHQNIIKRESQNLSKRIYFDVKNSKNIELRSLFSDFSTDVVSATLFGIDCNEKILGEKSPLREVTTEFNKFDKYRAMEWILLIVFPSLARFFGLTFFPKRSISYLKKTLYDAVFKRKRNIKSNLQQNLIDALVKMKVEQHVEGDTSDEVLIAQAVVFLEAGFESIALTLTNTVHELAFSPHVQKRLFHEITNNCVNSETLQDLTYLNCVIEESLRKCPPLGWLDRVASRDYDLDSNVVIPAGTPVYINVAGIQSDPEYYTDPDKFDPERFLPENRSNKNNLAYLSFGSGPRDCIGYKFAQLAIYYALTSLVRNFEIVPSSGTLSSERNFERRSLVLSPSKTHSVKFVPRSNHIT